MLVYFVYLLSYLYIYMKSRFDIDLLEDATETLRAIAHPIRIAIIDLLSKEEQLSVTQIHEALDIEQAIASHHLRILKGKKVVRVSREGKNSFYSLADGAYFSIIKTLLDKI